MQLGIGYQDGEELCAFCDPTPGALFCIHHSVSLHEDRKIRMYRKADWIARSLLCFGLWIVCYGHILLLLVVIVFYLFDMVSHLIKVIDWEYNILSLSHTHYCNIWSYLSQMGNHIKYYIKIYLTKSLD